jgi:diacylglycerol kinase (ATP)
MHAAVVINPIAGAGGRRDVGRSRAELATRVLKDLNVNARISVTSGAGEATHLTRLAAEAGVDAVIAWGGDGTVNEVASVLVGGPVSLGIIPAGSGNGLARELGLSRDPETALRGAVQADTVRIDVGDIGGRYFFNLAGIGFDAYVARRFNAEARGRRGVLPYVRLAAAALFRYHAREYEIRDSDLVCRGAATLIVIANSRQYGNGARIAPAAMLDDGWLDLVVVTPRSACRRIWDARRLFNETFSHAPGVSTHRIRHAIIRSDSALECHVDGESWIDARSLEVRVHPRALGVRVPGPLAVRPVFRQFTFEAGGCSV